MITLGLIETWRVKATGRFSCRPPATGGAEKAKFHLSNYEENAENLWQVFSLIFAHNDKAHVVLTVSPPPLQATGTDNDVVVANLESKSLLRAVAGQFRENSTMSTTSHPTNSRCITIFLRKIVDTSHAKR